VDYLDQLTSNAKIEIFINDEQIISFSETKDDICKEDGKPVIRLYTTSSCEPCKLLEDTFADLINYYMEDEEIAAYHWELDTGDNILTNEIEKGIPSQEIEIFKKYNPETTVPTYIFGCRYIRVGNFYEKGDDLGAEGEEFRAVIEKLLLL